MSLTVICPNCGNSLKASAEHVGRRAKCPRCGGSITIEVQSPPTPPAPKKAVPAKRSPTESGPPASVGSESTGRPRADAPAKSPQPRRYSRSHIVAASFVALAAGYIAGSFHPMDKLLGEFAEASKTIADSYRLPPGGLLGDGMDATDLADPSLRLREGTPMGSEDLEDGLELEPSLLPIGDEYQADRFSVALTDTRIDFPDDESSLAEDTSPTDSTVLICTFRVSNTDDQKILSIASNGGGGPSRFSIQDRAGNRIPDVDFRFSDGADAPSLTDDIPPGEQRTYVANVTIPGPPPEHLILSIDLKAFGGTGRIRFKITVTELQGILPEGP